MGPIVLENEGKHPLYRALRDRYLIALEYWFGAPAAREAAAALGLDQRTYCDRFLALFPPIPLTWSASLVAEPPTLTREDFDRAYQEALAAWERVTGEEGKHGDDGRACQ